MVKFLKGTEPSRQTQACNRGQFKLRDIEPRTFLWSVVKLKVWRQGEGFVGGQVGIECPGVVRVEGVVA